MGCRVLPVAFFLFGVVSVARGQRPADFTPATASTTLRLTSSVAESETEPNEKPVAETSRDSDWDFEFAPYLWAASLRSTTDDGRSSSTTEACFSDLVKHLDVGAMVSFDARHRSRWGLHLEGLYLKMSDDARVRVGPFRVRGIDVDATIAQAEIDFAGTYRIGEEGRALDLLFGGRYTHLRTEIDIGPLPAREDNTDFVAPLVGGRVRWNLSEKWLLSVKADTAGFDVGDAPDLTWGVTGILGYRLSDSAIFGVGYRYYDSSTDDDTDTDVSYHGPLIGLAWRF